MDGWGGPPDARGGVAMTFRKERYPADWKAIRAAIMARAGDACECTGQCGDPHADGPCAAPHMERILRDHREPARWSEHDPELAGLNPESTKVILTVAHVDHDERNNDPSNLLALCQRCHLKLDAADNLARKRERANAAAGQRPFPTMAAMPEHKGVPHVG